MENHTFIKDLSPQPGVRERRLAALAHAGILMYLLGMVTGPFWPCFVFPFIPALVLVINKGRDKWVSFHAWQAMLFQSLLCIGFLFIGIPAFLYVFARCAPGFGHTSSGCNEIFLPLTLAAVCALFVVPLGMAVLGLLKGVSVLGGNDVEYPLISRMVRKWKRFETL